MTKRVKRSGLGRQSLHPQGSEAVPASSEPKRRSLHLPSVAPTRRDPSFETQKPEASLGMLSVEAGRLHNFAPSRHRPPENPLLPPQRIQPHHHRPKIQRLLINPKRRRNPINIPKSPRHQPASLQLQQVLRSIAHRQPQPPTDLRTRQRILLHQFIQDSPPSTVRNSRQDQIQRNRKAILRLRLAHSNRLHHVREPQTSLHSPLFCKRKKQKAKRKNPTATGNRLKDKRWNPSAKEKKPKYAGTHL
jgi:hypothetical protein